MLKKVMSSIYRELVADHQSSVTFWVLVGFVPALVAARIIVSVAPGLFLSVHHSHVHHFTYGIIILAVAGYLALIVPKRFKRSIACFYGIGLALAFDEFGMWLSLTSNYNLDLSEDVLTYILIFLIVTVYFLNILRRAFRYLLQR